MNNKQVVRLTESQLHNIISESVKRVLKESYHWDGDTTPFETIISACGEIYDMFKGVYDRDPDDYDPETDSTICFDILDWVQEVKSKAEQFCSYNGKYISVGDGDLAGY